MKELILEILREIELDKEYVKLCQRYSDFDGRAKLTRKEVEPIIKSYDPDFRYTEMDKTFLKEISFEEFTVRFFIGFKSGIFGFGYLIWKEGENHNFYKGNLHTLSKEIDPEFEGKVKYNSPIATSLQDFNEILSKIFSLIATFGKRFKETVN
jgi:hypothetical protein